VTRPDVVRQYIRIRSSAFAANGPIPVKYFDHGRGASPPPEWGQLPAGPKSFLLMMEDPDATSPLRLGASANRHAVLEAAKGHVLAEGVLVGTLREAP